MAKLLPLHRDISVELTMECQFADIVADRCDAGVRLGENLAQDMIAVRIGPDLRMVVVGAPSYFADNTKPKTPHDLTRHRCINIRLSPRGSIYAWEFEKDGRPLNVRVEGQIVFNDTRMIMNAAVEGAGLAFVMEDRAKPYLADGTLVQVLRDWCPSFPGYQLYYPSRRQRSPAFAVLIEKLRYRDRRAAREKVKYPFPGHFPSFPDTHTGANVIMRHLYLLSLRQSGRTSSELAGSVARMGIRPQPRAGK